MVSACLVSGLMDAAEDLIQSTILSISKPQMRVFSPIFGSPPSLYIGVLNLLRCSNNFRCIEAGIVVQFQVIVENYPVLHEGSYAFQ